MRETLLEAERILEKTNLPPFVQGQDEDWESDLRPSSQKAHERECVKHLD